MKSGEGKADLQPARVADGSSLSGEVRRTFRNAEGSLTIRCMNGRAPSELAEIKRSSRHRKPLGNEYRWTISDESLSQKLTRKWFMPGSVTHRFLVGFFRFCVCHVFARKRFGGSYPELLFLERQKSLAQVRKLPMDSKISINGLHGFKIPSYAAWWTGRG